MNPWGRYKLAAARTMLATEPEGIERRIEKAFGRHLYGMVWLISADEGELRGDVEALIRRWMGVRQTRSTQASRARAFGIAMELCNLCSRYPVHEAHEAPPIA